ncbi:hypothetical protein AB0I22_01720 [Streptomyces sp. NPDC050610]|uniref:hypothetical protein n=1 Tax=Streptomyces sp. NPDC050610 TaxID=3157097 RepID=UPI003440CC85
MTSTTDTDEHPEVAEISALSEGILPPDRTADVRQHLADCELCEDVRSSLDEIRNLLGTLPGPVRMPDDVAGRIDAALAAEALLDSTAPSEAPSVSRETTPPREAASSVLSDSEVVSRETAHVPSMSADRPIGHSRAAAGPGRQGQKAGADRRTRRRRWPKALLGTACAAAVLTVGGLLVQSGLSDDTGGQAHTSVKKGQGDSSGLSSATLESRVQGLLATRKPAESRSMSAQSSPQTTLQDDGTTAPSCVREGTGRSDTPLAAHQETYEGQDVYLLVLPHEGDDQRVDAYIVASSCIGASSPTPGEVLLNRTYARD